MVRVVIEILSIGSNKLITAHTNPVHFGKIGGIMRSISNIGNIVGPLAVGVIMDIYGIGSAYVVLGCLMSVLAVVFYIIQKRNTSSLF